MSYTPNRLYLHGIVIPGDLHATNSVVVSDAEAEEDARERGYRNAYDVDEISGNGGSSVPVGSSPAEKDGVAPFSADLVPLPDQSPAEQLDALRAEAKALGLKPHHKAGADTLRALITEAAKGA